MSRPSYDRPTRCRAAISLGGGHLIRCQLIRGHKSGHDARAKVPLVGFYRVVWGKKCHEPKQRGRCKEIPENVLVDFLLPE